MGSFMHNLSIPQNKGSFPEEERIQAGN